LSNLRVGRDGLQRDLEDSIRQINLANEKSHRAYQEAEHLRLRIGKAEASSKSYQLSCEEYEGQIKKLDFKLSESETELKIQRVARLTIEKECKALKLDHENLEADMNVIE
jgi:chromosome segregation ATPase